MQCTWGTSGVLTVPHTGRGCHYGRNGAMWGTQTALLDSQSNAGVSLSGRSERGAVVVYLGVLAWVLTVPHKGRGCHYGRNGAVGRAQTAQCESQSNGGSELERALGARAVVWYLGDSRWC